MTVDSSRPYRCLIAEECSQAVLKSRFRKYPCRVIDQSREDFSIRLSVGRKMEELRRADRLELYFHGERWLVRARGNQHPDSDQLLLTRLQELTPIKTPSTWTSTLGVPSGRQADSKLLFVAIVAFVLTVIMLPGLGDYLGTSPKLKEGFQSVINAFQASDKPE
jgi:hypothetical protein